MRFTAVLPSGRGGLSFTATFTVKWNTIREPDSVGAAHRRDKAEAIRVVVRKRAAEISQECDLLDRCAAQDILIVKLNDRQGDDRPYGVNWRIVRVHLRVSKADQRRALEQRNALSEKYARIRREHAVAESMSSIVRDPAALCVWWLQHVSITEPPSKEVIGRLVEIAREAAEFPPSQGTDPSADWLLRLATWFWADLNEYQRTLMLEKICEIAKLVGGKEWSDRMDAIRHRGVGDAV